MKSYNFNHLGLALSFAILLTTGCSTGGAANTTPSIPTIGKATTYTSAIAPTISSEPTPTLTVEHAPLPFSGKIAFVHGNENIVDNDIYVMNADGSELRNLTATFPPYSSFPALSPDGKYIAFESIVDQTTQIFVMKTDGSDPKQVTFGENGEGSYKPAWSPDGEHIVFLSLRKNILDYRGVPADQGYIMKSDGTELRLLTSDQQLIVNGISYRGEDLIAISVPATPKTIRTYTINSNGVIQKKFPEITIDGIPIWSPNGNLIVYDTIRSNCSGIIVMQPDGSGQMCLILDKMIYPPVHSGGVSWSPEGEFIIFASDLGGDFDLYVVKTDGSDLTQLTNMPGNEFSPSWSAMP